MTVGALIETLQSEIRTSKIQAHDMVAVAVLENFGAQHFYFLNPPMNGTTRARTAPPDETRGIVALGTFDQGSTHDVTKIFKADDKG